MAANASRVSQTVRELLASAGYLRASSESPELDCQLLLAHTLSVDRAWLYTHSEDRVDDEAATTFRDLLHRRQSGEPVAYITGRKGFWDMDLFVTRDTLIPRPETELLVDAILRAHGESPLAVLDLGTGTGAIAIALARERPQWAIHASDASQPALVVAQENVDTFAPGRVTLTQSNWYTAIEARFDVIVCNPPYIAPGDPHLDSLTHEPTEALVAENDGLSDLEQVVEGAPGRLDAGGQLLVEHGFDQREVVMDLFRQSGFNDVTGEDDLAGQPRLVWGRLP